MMVELIICEKPSAARKIAEALADKIPVKKASQKVPYYELQHQGKPLLVGCAVGHLFGLVEKNKNGWTYPVFEIGWEATYQTDKGAKYVKDYIDTLAKLTKEAGSFTIACDYDVEGEVIGWNIIRFICKRKDANRMKFSTLTKEDLIEAYQNKDRHLNWGQAFAGETRHKLDWFYGINLSRALTASIKAAGSFKVMSIGRVQGPTLKLLADREKEITVFVPKPYWQLQLLGEAKKKPLEAWHKKDKFWVEAEVNKILEKIKGEKKAKVKEIKTSRQQQAPPHPFDLTTLQTESYRNFGLTPKATLELAQHLYVNGWISYPRTSSQQLDPKLGFKKILAQLGKQKEYFKFCEDLSKGKLMPNNGKKTDPAHPAIYPTGIAPQRLKEREKKVYDLIVKRFLATFGEAAVRETMNIELDVKKELFVAKGTRTLTEGWYKYYRPYVKLEEVELPKLEKGEEITIKKINKLSKETQPPKRYTQSSIIRELEKRNLGTKATRSDVLDRLFQRGYIEGVQIKVSKLGLETIGILEKHAPTIIDEELTRNFEVEMEEIREGKNKEEKVLEKAKELLIKLLDKFKKKEQEIGEELLKAVIETRDIESRIGFCPVCKKGELKIVRSRKSRKMFIACDRYPECETTFPLPQSGLVKSTDKSCEVCHYPKILIITRKRRPQEVCINPQCQSKEITKKGTHPREGKTCPKCKEGKLILRKGIYGEFIACDKFPKCRYTERIK